MSQYINAITAGLQVSDVIDIAIISYFVYRLLGFIRTSRAAQLAKGIVVLIVVYLLSGALHLYALNWVLEKILNIGLIALIIVFQPELRRALEVIGRGSFSLKKLASEKIQDPTDSADIISGAIAYFSSIKEGALIILERTTALNDIADTGTIIDAKMSEQLLENIFYLGSPLHDGAVIIRGDRVYAAGCVLPLTENTSLSKDLGTRHRAGIGITEQSDALVFIVSEETGIISMVEDGKISRFLDIKTVQKTLLAHYMDVNSGNIVTNKKIKSVFKGLKKEDKADE